MIKKILVASMMLVGVAFASSAQSTTGQQVNSETHSTPSVVQSGGVVVDTPHESKSCSSHSCCTSKAMAESDATGTCCTQSSKPGTSSSSKKSRKRTSSK